MKLRWTYRAEDEPGPTSKPSVSEGGPRPAFESSAAIVNGMVFIGNRAGALLAIDLKDGKLSGNTSPKPAFLPARL